MYMQTAAEFASRLRSATEPSDSEEQTDNIPRWDLSDLFESPTDPRIEEALVQAEFDANAFAAMYRGRIASLSVAPEELANAFRAFQGIYQAVAKPIIYANLIFAADTRPENGAFLQRLRERTTAATLPLIFFDLEIMEADGARLTALMQEHAALEPFVHYVESVRLRSDYRLSEAEERILEEQSNTGRRAFVRLFEEVTSNLSFTLEGHEQPLSLSQILNHQYDPDRTVRKASADALSAGLAREGRLIAYVFNTLIQDKATEDRIRGMQYPEQERHISNELTPDTVEAAVSVAEEGYALVSRYYKAKAKLLGLPTLAHYDRYAPVTTESGATIPFAEARAMCLDAFEAFDPEYAALAAQFFDNGWIDAAPAPTKRGGAFCTEVTPDLHPYVFMNYLGKAGDVKTLAHELGHAVHGALARPQGYLQFGPTLPMAEVASTFAEMLVFEERAKVAPESERLGLYALQIEQSFGTIFRQVALYRFEQAIHVARRRDGELSTEQFGALWQKSVGAMFGDSVVLEDGHAWWWSYVRHFVASPFYVYAYTFGEMLALAMYRRYREQGQAFVPLYIDLLRGGGAKSPHALVAPMGINLDDRAFWRGALEVLESEISVFERLAV